MGWGRIRAKGWLVGLGILVFACVPSVAGGPDVGLEAGGDAGGPAAHDAGVDAGAPLGVPDAGAEADGGVSDGGLLDAGTGTRDAGTADAGVADSGVAGPDASVPDSGVTDAGAADAGTDGGPDAGLVLAAPLSVDGWTFYAAAQGLSDTPTDVSADEAGNVYVAGGDALYAKTRAASTFLRFDASAGLTKNCDPDGGTMCRIISVAGGDRGEAVLGFKGIGTDDDYDPLWQQESGGCDVVAFDGQNLSRTRHVLIATPPGVVSESDMTWANGRRKGRQVFRVVFNHLPGIHHGDVWMAGTHVGFSVLFGNPQAEGWVDYPNQYPDSRGVWEHDHPAVELGDGSIETGDYYAVAIDPITGDPWAGNEYRTASKGGYGAGPGNMWNVLWPAYNGLHQLQSYLDVWPDCPGDTDPMCPYDIDNPKWVDNLMAMTFCDDGTLYLGSSSQGLAVRSPQGQLSYLPMPPNLGNSIDALACDPTDHSVWVGFGFGGIGRLHPDGTWSLFPTNLGAPSFVWQPVQSIQIDRWASPRIVYFAHLATETPAGQVQQVGGVTAYDGP